MRRIAALLLTVFAGTGVLGLAATATAAPASAAPLPLLAISCKQDVTAMRGQPVLLTRLSVSGFVADAIEATAKSLPSVNALTGSTTFDLGLALTVGTVPDSDGTISGAQIADAVVAAAKDLPQFDSARQAGLAALRDAVTKGCGMDVHVLNGIAPKDSGQPDSTSNVSSDGYQNPDQLWLYTPGMLHGDSGRRAPRDYSGIPAASPGAWAPSPAIRYGGAVPGYTPQFGIVGATNPADDAALRTAGNAQALPGRPAESISPAVLLAVLALSVVTGTLVRTWVLRRA